LKILEEIRDSVYQGDEEKALELVKKAVAEGYSPQDIMDNALVKGIQDCGAAYERQEMWIPELMLSTEALKRSLAILKPLMAGQEEAGRNLGDVVLATVEGDVHDIGVELVGVMLESAGFKVHFMGGNVPTADIIETVKKEKPALLGLSTLLSNTMPVIPKILGILNTEGIRDSVKVMVGGAVIREGFSERVGADGFAPDAVRAVPLAKKLRGVS